jgi:hypothetical protein
MRPFTTLVRVVIMGCAMMSVSGGRYLSGGRQARCVESDTRLQVVHPRGVENLSFSHP